MSLISDLMQMVANLTTRLNEIGANSKRTEEMQLMNPIDRSSLIRLSKNGLSYKTPFQGLIDEMGVDDGVVQIGELEIVPDGAGGESLKIPEIPNPIWRIQGQQYTKNTETLIPIPYAANEKYRTDIIVGNTSNGFDRLEGVEGDNIGIPPSIPPNTVEITRLNIFGNQIGSPTLPTTVGFITKASKQYRTYTFQQNNPQSLFLSHEYTTHIIQRDSNANDTKICNGFMIDNIDTAQSSGYDGMDIYIKSKNNGVDNIILTHNDQSVDVPFWFANGLDLEIKKDDIIHLKMNKSDNRVEYVGIGQGGSIEIEIKPVPTTTYTLEEADHDKDLYFTHNDGCVVTVPAGLPKNKYRGKQMGDDPVEFEGDGTTVECSPEFVLKTAGKNSVWALDWDATDEYTLYGVLELSASPAVVVTKYSELDDKESVDLPIINTPLKNSLTGKEDKSNKATDLSNPDDTKYPTTKAVDDALQNVGGDLEIYSESGTLAGGDGVAIIGDYDPVVVTGSGIHYDQTSKLITGTGDLFNFIAENIIGIISKGYLTIDGQNVLIIARQSVIDFYNASNKALKFDFSNITAARTLTFQDKSGVAALVSDLVEEKIIGTATYQGITGTTNINLKSFAHRNIRLTGHTDITFTNTPAINESFARTYKVWSTEKTFTLGIANSTDEFGSYEIAEMNTLTVLVANTGTLGLTIDVFFSQP